MSIDPDVAVGATLPEIPFTWTESDVLLYHLAIGAGGAPGDNARPRRCAGRSRVTGCRCCRPSASWRPPST